MESDNIFIRFDWAIKHMLRDKANFEILEGLLTVLIGEDVKIKEILENGKCKTITEHIKLGERYSQVKKVYSISILYCDFGEGDDYVKEVFPEYYLLRVKKFNKIPDSPLDEWMDYLILIV